MKSKFEIVNKKWIVKSYTQNTIDYESSIRIAAVTGVEIQYGKKVTWIKLYGRDAMDGPVQFWYEPRENKQFEKDVKFLRGLIYKS